ncbi:MAG TPA: hypothetical protein PLB22_12660, partial [Ottowia sp.]|nr:hypothetical protein [Ottowia sp.]
MQGIDIHWAAILQSPPSAIARKAQCSCGFQQFFRADHLGQESCMQRKNVVSAAALLCLASIASTA